MAGVDGSLVMVGEATTTDGEEVEMPQKKEMFVLLDNVPQASYFTPVPVPLTVTWLSISSKALALFLKICYIYAGGVLSSEAVQYYGC